MQNEHTNTMIKRFISVSRTQGSTLAARTLIALLLALGFGSQGYAATCEGKTATIVGTKQGETIMGTPGRDVIQAREGNDVVYGLEGDDVICSGLGNDTVYGGYGNLASGSPSGNDRLRGGDNMDTVFGEDGNDFVDGGCPCPFRESTVKDKCDGGTGTKDVAQNCEIKTGFP